MSQYNIVDSGSTPAPNVETLTGNTGGAVPPTGNNINILGSGSVNVAGNAGTSTLTISISGSGLAWNVITATSANMLSNNGYITNNAALVTLTLPATSSVGDYIAIMGLGAGGWAIAQAAGQQVRIGANASTVGVTGSVSSANQYDSLELICVVANTLWFALGGPESAGLIIA